MVILIGFLQCIGNGSIIGLISAGRAIILSDLIIRGITLTASVIAALLVVFNFKKLP
jgi:hypothetical protein